MPSPTRGKAAAQGTGAVLADDGYKRTAIDVAREFVSEQAMGEWGDEVEERDAQRLAALLNAYAAAPNREVVVPWAFGCTDCLHPRGREVTCQIFGCPRQALAEASPGKQESNDHG